MSYTPVVEHAVVTAEFADAVGDVGGAAVLPGLDVVDVVEGVLTTRWTM